jgi:hypothetical protein
MFQKLDIKLDIDLKKLRGRHLNVYAFAGYFIQYEIADQEYLNALLNNVVEFQIPPDQVNITKISFGGGLSPHSDVWDTALNYYVHAEKEVTTFYDNPSGYKVFDESSGLHGYDVAQLIPVANFVANTNDCYLLNTAVPHNVSYDVKNSSRTFLRFMWNRVPFEEVLKSICIK